VDDRPPTKPPRGGLLFLGPEIRLSLAPTASQLTASPRRWPIASTSAFAFVVGAAMSYLTAHYASLQSDSLSRQRSG
jgi:hypothetical protein